MITQIKSRAQGQLSHGGCGKLWERDALRILLSHYRRNGTIDTLIAFDNNKRRLSAGWFFPKIGGGSSRVALSPPNVMSETRSCGRGSTAKRQRARLFALAAT